MDKSVELMCSEFNKIRTGRAHPSLLDEVKVDYYGTLTPLSQMAGVAVEGGRSLVITPWDRETLPLIEKAIIAANLGFNPSTQEDIVRVHMPPMTEERRQEYVRQAKQIAEQARVSLRNIRRDANQSLKNMCKDSEIGKDVEQSANAQIEKIIKEYTGKVDEALQDKESDLKEI